MPLIVAKNLPAITHLKKENRLILEKNGAVKPTHKILLLNLMPIKETTELDFIRLLSSASVNLELQLMRIENHESKNTSKEHLEQFYKTFDEVKQEKYDGFIITGAPVEQLEFEQVRYWEELTSIFDWVNDHIPNALFICWGAQAGLYYFHKIKKIAIPNKLSGIFEHTVRDQTIPLFKSFNDLFYVPHSRHSEMCRKDIESCSLLEIIAESPRAGIHIIRSLRKNFFFISGHHEYSKYALDQEYKRDLKLNLPINQPYNYYLDNDQNQEPMDQWQSHAQLLFDNWINYYVTALNKK